LLLTGYADTQIASCDVVELEVLYRTRSLPDYLEVRQERRSLLKAPIMPEVMGAAVNLQEALAARGQHRLALPDLIISAAAWAAGLTVLHYDADFERIAEVGGADHG
jgi:predicted nucleic acid-binding protein